MKWKRGYIKKRLKQIIGKKDKMLNLYDEMVKKSTECKDSAFNRFDFLCSYIMFGVEPEDYFSYDFYEHRNPFFRNHHVNRTRMNYIKEKLNKPEAIVTLNSKADFNRIYADYLGRKWCSPHEVDEETFISTLKGEGKEVFVKFLSGYGGRGAFRTSAEADNLKKLYKELTEGDAKYIVEEYFDQKGFLRDVNPSSLNTIRVTTARAKASVVPLYAYYRAGGADSPVDNLHSGGVRYTIDINTGKLLKGINYTGKDITNHPSTGIKVAGYVIPKWDEVLDFAKKLHMLAPEGANLVGWDICLSDDKMVVIEGNAGPGFPQEVRFSDNTWKKVRRILDSI